jgi:hypothetical protein
MTEWKAREKRFPTSRAECPKAYARGYPAWIRTKNNASKGRCVTVTPRGKIDGGSRLATLGRSAITKSMTWIRTKNNPESFRGCVTVTPRGKSASRFTILDGSCYSRDGKPDPVGQHFYSAKHAKRRENPQKGKAFGAPQSATLTKRNS